MKNQPSLVCQNKNDAFTVNDTIHGNGDLTYPIALLIFDEMVLAGDVDSNGDINMYMNNSTDFWTISTSRIINAGLTITNGYAMVSGYGLDFVRVSYDGEHQQLQ